MLKKVTLILLACATLSACNTFEGLGRDISTGGKAVTGVAKEAKESIENR